MPQSQRTRAAKSPDKQSSLLSRPQVAALLGISEKEVEALHGVDLHPTQDNVRRWRYSPAEVAAVSSGHGRGSRNDGEIAAAAFALFREGKSLADAVITLKLAAPAVRALQAEYEAMTGGSFLDEKTRAEVHAIAGVPVLGEPGALVPALRAALQEQYRSGYADGAAETEDCGEIIDFATGERRRLAPRRPSV